MIIGFISQYKKDSVRYAKSLVFRFKNYIK